MARLAHVNKPSFAGEEREHCHLGVLCLAPNATALVQGAPRSAFARSEGTQECEQAYLGQDEIARSWDASPNPSCAPGPNPSNPHDPHLSVSVKDAVRLSLHRPPRARCSLRRSFATRTPPEKEQKCQATERGMAGQQVSEELKPKGADPP